MKANITTQIGGYLFDFNEIDIKAKVSRLDVHKDGRVTGELTMSSGNKTILMPSSIFNFSSAQTRSVTAGQMWKKFPDNHTNWAELFDFLAHKTQELAKEGEPAREVWAENDAEAPEFLLEPIIYKNQSNIIYGEKGVSKSTMAYAMGMCMALPWHNNPLEFAVPNKPTVSLVLDWETDEKTFAYYLSRLKRGMNCPRVGMYYRHCRLPLMEELEEIERYISDVKADLLIIDSIAMAAGGETGELKGSQSALSFNTALRKLKRTSLCIGQTSKDISSPRKTIFGSAMFTYYARNILELCRHEEEDTSDVHLALFHRECNLGRKHQPMGFCLTFDDANRSLSIKRESVTVSEFVGKVTSQNAVADALKSGLKTVKDIKEVTGLKENNIRTSLSRLKSLDKVTKIGDRWGLRAYHQEDMSF